MSYKQLIVWVVTAVLLLAFWFVVTKTALGRAQRACEQDQKMAALLGIDVDRTISITFVIAAALAAVAGTMYLMYYGVVSFADGFVPGVKAFTAAVLGGIGSLPGAVLGGLLIGLIETMWSAYFSVRLQGRRRLLDPGHHHDLPAAGHTRPARRGEGVDGGDRTLPRASISFARLREGAIAGLVAFGLFLPLIGFKTVQNIRNELVLETRWPLLAALVAIIAAGRFLYALVIAPGWRAAPCARDRSTPARGLAPALRARNVGPFMLGFALIYPPLALWLAGFQGAANGSTISASRS